MPDFSLYRFLARAHGCSSWAPFSHAWSDVTHVRLGWFVLSPHSLPRRRAVPAVLESLFCLGKVSGCEIFLWPRGWGCHPQSSFLHPLNALCWYVEDFHNFYLISVLHSSDTENIWCCQFWWLKSIQQYSVFWLWVQVSLQLIEVKLRTQKSAHIPLVLYLHLHQKLLVMAGHKGYTNIWSGLSSSLSLFPQIFCWCSLRYPPKFTNPGNHNPFLPPPPPPLTFHSMGY